MDKGKNLREHVNRMSKVDNIFSKALEFYNAHIRYDITAERLHFVNQQAELACWFYCLAKINVHEFKKLGFNSVDEFHTTAIETLRSEAELKNWKGFHCCSLKSIYKKLTPFKQASKGKIILNKALESLLSNKYNNSNSQRLGTRQQLHIIEIFRRTEEPNYKKTHRIYLTDMRTLVGLGIWNSSESEISLSGMTAFLRKPEVERLLDPSFKLRINTIF